MPVRDHFRLRSYQLAVLQARNEGAKRFVCVWHRRAGKDRTFLAITLTEMLKRVGVYFHVFPSLNQGRRDLWDNVIQEYTDGVETSVPMLSMFPPELVAARNEAEMQIRLKNGSIWQIMGADSLDAIERLRGPNPVGVVFSEYSYMLKEAWDTLIPVFAENKGWAAFIFTPNGENHAYDLYQYASNTPDWYTSRLTIEDTRRDAVGENNDRVVDPIEIQALRDSGQREEYIQQEFYVSFTGYQHGTIYGDLFIKYEDHVRNVPYNTTLPVGTCWDLGVSDAIAIWFYQISGTAINFIDYMEESQKGTPYFARILREHKEYVYGRHVLPWDGHNAEAYLSTLGFRNIHVCQRTPSLRDSIDKVRTLFSTFYFDKVRCERGIEALRKYRRVYDEIKRSFSQKPQHDQYSHGADALRTGVEGGFNPLIHSGAYHDQEIKVETEFRLGLGGEFGPKGWGR